MFYVPVNIFSFTSEHLLGRTITNGNKSIHLYCRHTTLYWEAKLIFLSVDNYKNHRFDYVKYVQQNYSKNLGVRAKMDEIIIDSKEVEKYCPCISVGPDSIPNLVLKNCALELSVGLSVLFVFLFVCNNSWPNIVEPYISSIDTNRRVGTLNFIT